MKFLCSTVLAFSLTLVLGQKELTLEDAVLGQYRQFYPENVFGFEWIPNSSEYSFLDGYVNLKKGSLEENSEEMLLSIAEVNGKLGTQLYYFQNFTWKT